MKKILLLFGIILTVSVALGQNAKKAKDMLAEISGKYTVDENGNVTYVKIIEIPGMSKDEVFMRANNYFAYNYGSGKSVIQINDKEAGIIVAKGFFGAVHTDLVARIDTWHILRIDVRDNRCRAILSLTEYNICVDGKNRKETVSKNYPININGRLKTMMMKGFYNSHYKALKTLESLEKAINEGTTDSSIENADW